MKIKSTSIKDVIFQIAQNKLFLPPIQRSFVWDRARITNLLDSLYRDYPIGNCIFWKLEPDTSKSYPLYKFLGNYSENKAAKNTNELAPTNLLEESVSAVVDGQQRLSSLFIGLVGNYRYKKAGKGRKNIDSNFFDAKIHINLFKLDQQSDDDPIFQFLTKEDAKVVGDKTLWFEIGQTLKWENDDSAADYLERTALPVLKRLEKKSLIEKLESKKPEILAVLQTVRRMLHEERMHYFEIDNQNLDEVVDIFTRINSGGMTLKKSDLLFSALVTQWSEGREEIKELIDYMRDNGVDISQDFIMRCCLTLSDLPVKYKLESFKNHNISVIKENWPAIRDSLETMCELIDEMGYAGIENLSDNALIPIAYYIRNNGNIKSLTAKRALQRYYVASQLNGMFSGQSDQVLEKVRAEIKGQLADGSALDFDKLSTVKLPGKKKIGFEDEDLEEMLSQVTYPSAEAYFLLSLVYPTIDHKKRTYHMDHIHPKSKFNVANLKRNGITDPAIIKSWRESKKDLLPNLQLLDHDSNFSKGSTPIADFVKKMPARDRREFLKENLLPAQSELGLENFENFYDTRKRKLLTKLKRKLCA